MGEKANSMTLESRQVSQEVSLMAVDGCQQRLIPEGCRSKTSAHSHLRPVRWADSREISRSSSGVEWNKGRTDNGPLTRGGPIRGTLDVDRGPGWRSVSSKMCL